MRTTSDRVPALARAGNFWSTTLRSQDREMVRHLAHTAFLSAMDEQMEATVTSVLGGGWTLQDSLDIPWNPSDVVMVGPDLQERLATLWASEGSPSGVGWWATARPTEYTLGADDHGFIQVTLPDNSSILISTYHWDYCLFPAEGETDGLPISPLDLRPKWLVPVPLTTRPQVLEIPGRFLVSGIDFQWMPGLLVFEENPHQLFSESISCQSGWILSEYALSYAQGVDMPLAPTRAVAFFQMEAQTPHTLLRALAELIGRVVIEEGRWVTGVMAYGSTRVYQLDDGQSITLECAHYDYQIGDFIPAGSVLGGGIQVWGPGRSDNSWYKHCPWDDGLDLSTVSPFRDTGLYIPNAPCRFEAYDTTGAKLHVRPWLPGRTDNSHVELQRYWAWIRAAEIASGKYLNDVLALAVEGDDVMIHALDFFFDYGLVRHSIVIHLDPAVINSSEKARLVSFLERERLHDIVYIILP